MVKVLQYCVHMKESYWCYKFQFFIQINSLHLIENALFFNFTVKISHFENFRNLATWTKTNKEGRGIGVASHLFIMVKTLGPKTQCTLGDLHQEQFPTPGEAHVIFVVQWRNFFISEFVPFVLIHLNHSNHRKLSFDKGKGTFTS